jgi:hypothetical protein
MPRAQGAGWLFSAQTQAASKSCGNVSRSSGDRFASNVPGAGAPPPRRWLRSTTCRVRFHETRHLAPRSACGQRQPVSARADRRSVRSSSHVRGDRCRARIRHAARFGALIDTSLAVSSTHIFRLPSAGEANLRFRWCSAGSGGPDRWFSAMATLRGSAVVALQRSAMVDCGAARDVHQGAT